MGQRWAPGANQFVIQLSFFQGTEAGTRTLLRYFRKEEGGTKGESVCLGLEFLSWGRGEHQERIILSGVKFLSWAGGGDWRGAWRICMARH
jgi:hypothetical protein